MLKNTEYKKKFLSDVIFRIDFSQNQNISKDSAIEFQNKLDGQFPGFEPVYQDLVILNKNNEGVIETKNQKITVWKFSDIENNSYIELSNNFLVINLKRYKNFTKFKTLISKILDIFFAQYPSSTDITRTGLRYINQIELNEKNPLSWDKYINSSLIENLNFFKDKKRLKRSMQTTETSIEDDIVLRVNSGIYNSNYPNQIVTKEFILDYDCFIGTNLKKENLMEKISQLNKIITDTFELSVRPEFRKLLDK